MKRLGTYSRQSSRKLRHRLVEGQVFEEFDPSHHHIESRNSSQKPGTKKQEQFLIQNGQT